MSKKIRSSLSLFVIATILVVIAQYLNLTLPKSISSLTPISALLSPAPTTEGQVAGATSSPILLPTDGTTAVVSKVVDGDTIQLSTGEKLRYIGIDTPESKKPNTPVQCFALKAYERNKQLVEGRTVQLVKDVSETDRYGRLLRYVYVDGQLVNEILVKEGYAFARSYPPDIALQDRFTAAESDARTNSRGLWSECTVENEHVRD